MALPTKSFFEEMIKHHDEAMLKSRIAFERSDAVRQFCQFMLDNGNFVPEPEIVKES